MGEREGQEQLFRFWPGYNRACWLRKWRSDIDFTFWKCERREEGKEQKEVEEEKKVKEGKVY